MNIIFATNNLHKLEEIRNLLDENINLLSLSDIDFFEEISEDYDTLEDNAMQKARIINQKSGINCFADDTGLEIDALNNEPGVYSARYAGEQKNSIDNMNKVLEKMKNQKNRKARFRTAIALIVDKKEFLFEGIVNGEIIDTPRGKEGFGYDPIFIPDGYSLTFAEMQLGEKNLISHRARAFNKLKEFLKNYK